MTRRPNSNTARSKPLLRWRVISACIAASCLPMASHAGGAEAEVIVQLTADTDITPLLVKHQLSLIGRIGTRPIYRLKALGTAKVKETIDALSRESAVYAAEANVAHEGVAPFTSSNMPWAIGDPSNPMAQWAFETIRLADAHRVTRGSGIRIALLDSGVDASHPALAGRLLRGFDFVDGDDDPSEVGDATVSTYGHGTHVAGILALVAPEARIMPMRILDTYGTSNTWILAEAMLRAMDPDGDPSTDDGAHVINLSVGTLSKTQLFKTVAKLVTCKLPGGQAKGETKGDGKGDAKGDPKGASAEGDDDEDNSDIGVTVADKARCQGFGGAVVVAAAGNHGNDKVLEYPAGESSKGLLSVAASSPGGALASFSNYGWVKLAAPGEGVTSAVPGGGYATWSGTSMASPIVAATAALVRAANRSMPVEDVVKRLESSTSKLCSTPLKQIDAGTAVTGASPTTKPTCK